MPRTRSLPPTRQAGTGRTGSNRTGAARTDADAIRARTDDIRAATDDIRPGTDDIRPDGTDAGQPRTRAARADAATPARRAAKARAATARESVAAPGRGRRRKAAATTELTGVIPYLVSPVNPRNGKIQRPVLARLCRDLIGSGVHGLSPLGSTGEFAYLDAGQREDVVGTVIDAAKGRVPVIPGVASTTTADAVAQARRYEKLGAGAILAVLEAYFPIDPDGIYSYFKAIADAVSVPVVIYTNPNFQRSDLTLPIIDRLSHVPNIRYLKDASTNTGRLLSIIEQVDGRMSVFAASSHIPAAVMLIGGVGFMAGPACLVPRQSVELYELCRAGAWDEAMALQRRLWRVNQVFAKYNLAACIKGGLDLQGYPVGDPLPPQAPLTAEGRAAVKTVLEDLGAL